MAIIRLAKTLYSRRPRARRFDPAPDQRDRTKAELLNSLKTSMGQVQAGDYRPALEVLDELDNEAPDDAHSG